MGETKSTELVLFPTDKAVARRVKDLIATSPKNIQRGQAVALDRHGVAVARSRFTRILSMWKLGTIAVSVGGMALYMSGAAIPGALLYVAGLSPALFGRYRGTSKLLAIDIIRRNGHLDAAQRRLDLVPQLRRRNPVVYCTLAGTLASHRGDHGAAVTWWREGFPRSTGVARELLKIRIATSLLLAGRIDEARREYDSVAFSPEADQVLTGQGLTRAMFVLLDPTAKLPPSEELHDWARLALEYSHAGIELATIGWAFERIGDEDMARFLATEAVDRIHHPYLARWWPELQHWLDGHASKP